MPTDPRYVVRVLFDPEESSYAITDTIMTDAGMLWENGATRAKHQATYEEPRAMLTRLMNDNPHNYDVLFTILLLGEEPPDDYGGGPVCYNYLIGIQPVTIDKYNSDESLKVDGDKLQRAAKEVIRVVIGENPFGSLRNVRSTTRNTERIGTALVYGDIMEVLYKQYASKY